MTSGAGASYTYNAQGLRTSKTVNKKKTSFNLINGKVWSDGTYNYVWGAELITNGSVYYLYNAHGDVVQLVNASGTVTKTYDYEAYGNELTRDAADSNPFRYCGEYYDNETGFIYLRARYYDPSVGRFISKDPHWNVGNMIYGDNPAKDNPRPDMNAIKQSGNLYAYCMDNPVLFADANGEWIHIAVGAVVGGVLGGVSSFVSQAFSGGKFSMKNVDYTKVLINAAGGAVGGALTAAGFGAISSGVVSGATNIVEQEYENKGDLSKVNYVDTLTSFVTGVIGGKLGTNKAKVNHVSKMTGNLTKKIGKALSKMKLFSGESISKSAKAIFSGIKYFISQTSDDLAKSAYAVIKSYIPSWAYIAYQKVSDWRNTAKC